MQAKVILILIDLLKTDYNAKMTELENKIPNINGLATNSALNAIENKHLTLFVQSKTYYDTKISQIEKKITDHNHDRYITTPEFNKFTAEIFPARLKQANIVTKKDFNTKLKGLNQKINSNKAKYLLGGQNLLFQLMYKYFKKISGFSNDEYIYSWKSTDLSDQKINSVAASSYNITPEFSYYGSK